ncbi:MAG: hypothetical protein ACXAC5_11725 [Promethearchaeota archaeon]|jgi:hypothetical protein
MSWLKRQQPIELYQGSDIPYVILQDGVRLSYDNCYGIQPDNLDHNICFLAEPSLLKRINTYFYKFESFPITLPFSDIISLDDAIVEGRIIERTKHGESSNEPKCIAIIQSEYIRHADVSRLNDTLDEFDASFILVDENIDPQARLFEDISVLIYHQGWARTLVTIADKICDQTRKYCWSQSIPELSISVYGISDSDELMEINDTLNLIGMDASVNWAD